MLATRTNITKDKIVLRYEKSDNKLDLRFFFNSADRCRGSCYPMGQQIGAVDPATQLASRQVPWILLPNWPADRCRGSCPVGQQIGAVDPATQWASRQVPWILLPSGPAGRCRRSCYPIGQQTGAVDPATKWAASRQAMWILLLNGPTDRCQGSCYPMGQQIGAKDPATQLASRQVPWILLGQGNRFLGSLKVSCLSPFNYIQYKVMCLQTQP